MKKCFDSDDVKIATLVRKVAPGEDLLNPNQIKVVIDKFNRAIYFSRSVIPFIREAEPSQWTLRHSFYKHIGLYAYRTDVLEELTRLSRTPLEIAESLEQNRWIENGFKINTAVTKWESIGIDTPEDLEKAKALFSHFFDLK